MSVTITNLVKGQLARLDYICNGIAYFNISETYQFPINLNDSEWKDVYIRTEYKSITLMRWIRKAMENNELIRIK
jgi:hypothetical protein